MSLDVTLYVQEKCPECGHVIDSRVEVFSANITHNLTNMADEAGIYEALWRPEEKGWVKAGDLIEPIRKGLDLMRSNAARFRAHDAPNGWGTYEDFIPWIQRYLDACIKYPDAVVDT